MRKKRERERGACRLEREGEKLFKNKGYNKIFLCLS